MLVNKETIQVLHPCSDRFNNFLEQYPNFSGTMIDFLKLENITYSDKVWVFTRVLNKNTLVRWSIACAESVLHIFENKHPNDTRVRNCLEVLKNIPDYENMTEENRTAAYAAYAAASDAYYATDASAAYAADAADAAAYAADAATARSAAASAASAASAANTAAYYASKANEKIQENKNIELLIKVLEKYADK